MEKIKDGFCKKGIAFGIALSLVVLILSVMVPSTSAVKLDPGTPNDTSVSVGVTIFFSDVVLMIRGVGILPVDYLVFSIFNSLNHQQIASVNFSLDGDELSDPAHRFDVVNVTDISDLPFQKRENHHGHGYGYGYGYGPIDLTNIYTISYITQSPGKFYAKLFVISEKHTYASGKSKPFTVSPAPASPKMISVDILPGHWPNLLCIRNHGFITVAICGNASFNVCSIDQKSIRLSLDGGKKQIKPLFICPRDVATPSNQNGGRDGYRDLTLKFRNSEVVHVFKLFKRPCDRFHFTITATLKTTMLPIEGHDSLQIRTGSMHT